MKQLLVAIFLQLALLGGALADTLDSLSQSYSLEKEGDYHKAIEAVRSLSLQYKNAEFIYLRLGWLNYLSGDYTSSTQYYRKALMSNLNSIDARLGLTLPLMATEKWTEVESEAQAVLRADPWNYIAHIRLMMCEYTNKQWSTLASHAKEVAKHYPSSTDAWLYVARGEAWLLQREKAIEAYQQALIRSPNNSEATNYINKTGKTAAR